MLQGFLKIVVSHLHRCREERGDDCPTGDFVVHCIGFILVFVPVFVLVCRTCF
jgi:hypothetical protein